MSNEVITHKHEWVRWLFSELDRIAKDATTMADENQPLLGGEHCLTDRELSERLKISRRTLQDYRNNGILPYRQLRWENPLSWKRYWASIAELLSW